MNRAAIAGKIWAGLCTLVAALIGLTVANSPAMAGSIDIEPRSPLAREAHYHAVAWKLAAGNAPYCANTWQLIGLTLQDNNAKDGSLVVLSAAPQSPAARAGLRDGDRIVSIGRVVSEDAGGSGTLGQSGLEHSHRLIESLLEQNGEITLGLEDSAGRRDAITIPAQSVCPTRFLTRAGKKIGADGVNVRFGLGFAGFDYPDDEFAAAIAHEFAHNLMEHPYWLDHEGRTRRNVRLTEREADRLMPWLLANAGYDPFAAQRFMERWGPRHGGGLLRKRTHDGWDERAEMIAAEAAIVREVVAEKGSADWQAHFRREEGFKPRPQPPSRTSN